MCAAVHVRYDYQAADLGSMLEILACMKGVACLLQQANTWMSGYLYQAVYLQMQTFVQLALTHTDPRSKVRVFITTTASTICLMMMNASFSVLL